MVADYAGLCRDAEGRNPGDKSIGKYSRKEECLKACIRLRRTGCMYWQSGGVCYYITGNVVKGSGHSGFTCIKLVWFLIQKGGLPARVHPSEMGGMYVLAE